MKSKIQKTNDPLHRKTVSGLPGLLQMQIGRSPGRLEGGWGEGAEPPSPQGTKDLKCIPALPSLMAHESSHDK